MTTLSLSAIKDQLKDKNGFIDTSLIRKYIFEKFSDYKFKDLNRGSYAGDDIVFALQQGIDWCNDIIKENRLIERKCISLELVFKHEETITDDIYHEFFFDNEDCSYKTTYFIKVELIRNPLTYEKTAYLNIDWVSKSKQP